MDPGGDGRERVRDYPRPPALVPCTRHVRVEALGRVLADSHRSLRVLETFHPPTFYLPPEAVDRTLLEPAGGGSLCEWKGRARYFDVVAERGGAGERRLRRAVWQYPHPTPAYAALAGWFAVYPARMDGCWVDGERVRPQPGGFYGGWITADVEGPFKGDPRHPELI
ncbi:MAG: DUF427 domain-containing protein [Synechococcaceae cyanobacterium]|nr:DUF427 domain-containing protein [Synechococcaceae cyanobacterium]